MIEKVTEDNVSYNHPPHRFEAGTPPIVQAIGLGAAHRLHRERRPARTIAAPTRRETWRLCQERLSRINSLRIFGTAPGKGAIRLLRAPGPPRP